MSLHVHCTAFYSPATEALINNKIICWNIDSRKTIWHPRAHFGSKNDSLKGLNCLARLALARERTPSRYKLVIQYDKNMHILITRVEGHKIT